MGAAVRNAEILNLQPVGTHLIYVGEQDAVYIKEDTGMWRPLGGGSVWSPEDFNISMEVWRWVLM